MVFLLDVLLDPMVLTVYPDTPQTVFSGREGDFMSPCMSTASVYC